MKYQIFVLDFFTSSIRSVLRAQLITTWYPQEANFKATARPIPREEPVTRTVFFIERHLIFYFSLSFVGEMYNCSSIEEGKVVRLSDVRSITYQVKSYNGNDENPPEIFRRDFV